MQQSEKLTSMAIQDIAFRTIGQEKNCMWKAITNGKLNASMFGMAVQVMKNPHWLNIRKLRFELYGQNEIIFTGAHQWKTDHKSIGIDDYVTKSSSIVQPTGIWLYANSFMYASPDGIIFKNAKDRQPIGILLVECPFYLRKTHVADDEQWHEHLSYVDEDNQLKRTSDQYHIVQGSIFAVNVQWCDFVVWTPLNMLIIKVFRDEEWAKQYLDRLAKLYNQVTLRSEDRFDEQCVLHYLYGKRTNNRSYQPARDLNAIINPKDMATNDLRKYLVEAFSDSMREIIFSREKKLKMSNNWSESVKNHWLQSIKILCEPCLREYFKKIWFEESNHGIRFQVMDIMRKISTRTCEWKTLLYAPDFAGDVRRAVKAQEPDYLQLQVSYCACGKRYINT